MKIIIPGGSGQIGRVLAHAFHQEGHEVVVLSRRPEPRPWRVMTWDGETPGRWMAELEGADVVINLAGQSVNCRYHARNREILMQSRLRSVRILGEAFNKANSPPALFLQAGTATIYAHRYDAPNDEMTGIMGGQEPALPETWKFSYGLAYAWEEEFNKLSLPGTRKVILRMAMMMSPSRGGVFDMLMRLTRFGLGGHNGNGRQFMSWIHHEDLARSVQFLIERKDISGPVNLSSPNPLPNAEFMRELRNACGIPFGLPSLEWMLEIGAIFLRTESELILKSRRVIPGRLEQEGFTFRHPNWPDAAKNLHQEWKKTEAPQQHDQKSELIRR